MVQVAWVSLRPYWSLSSVQAVLQVLIAVVCTVGIFVFSRFCWQLSSLHVAKNEHVPLPLLISIRTVGEAFDAIFLLRRKIFLKRHWRLLTQSVVVILLSVAIIVSGPIAKASTRIGTVVQTVTQTGLLTNRGFNSIGYGLVAWNRTLTALDQADFPYDQLLDYLPDGGSHWIYRPNEWNSTWKMDCNATDQTPIELTDTGNCANLYYELPALDTILPVDNFDQLIPSYYGIYNGTEIADGLIFLTGWTYSINRTTNVTDDMTFSVAAVNVRGLVKNDNKTNGCFFGKGPVETASFSMAQCSIHRSREVRRDEVNIAFPDHVDWSAVTDAYVQNYIPRMAKESAAGKPITQITPEQLIRFYQVYTVTKDTFRENPVPRQISARISVVQISSTYLALAILMIVLNLVGLAYIVWFSHKHSTIISETPESKLDWAVQSIMKGGGAGGNSHSTNISSGGGRNSHSRYSVVATNMDSHDHLTLRKAHQLRHHFENARFGNVYAMHDSVPLTHNPGHAGGPGGLAADDSPALNQSSSTSTLHNIQSYNSRTSYHSLSSPPPASHLSQQYQPSTTTTYPPPQGQPPPPSSSSQHQYQYHQRQTSFPSHLHSQSQSQSQSQSPLYGAATSPYEAQFAAHDTTYNATMYNNNNNNTTTNPSLGFTSPDYQTYRSRVHRGYQQLPGTGTGPGPGSGLG